MLISLIPTRNSNAATRNGSRSAANRAKVPREFVICLNFNPTATKGVYVSHDKEGTSLVGLPGNHAGSFTGGDWMLRVEIDTLKPQK